MYYYCSCKPKKEGNRYKKYNDSEGFHLTEADSEGICLRCGYYSIACKYLVRGSKITDFILKGHYAKEDKTVGISSIAALKNKKRRENEKEKNN